VIQLCRRTWLSILGKLTFQVSEGGKVENFDNRIHEIMKPKIPKRKAPIRKKGTIILLWLGELSGALCWFTWGMLIRTCGKTPFLCVCRIPCGGT
jgi:hypothetical protein